MEYNNIVQKARRKYLNRAALSPEEQSVLDKDFNGKDYIFYKENDGKDFLFDTRYSADQTFPRIKQAISQHTAYKKKLLIRYIGSAAAILIISFISFHLYKMSSIPQMKYVSTSYGEHKNISLPDGTVITLNSLSSISYPQDLKGDTRQVELKGEAYFDVASEADRPFIVKANDLEIRVLGTKFNIEAYENEENIITSLFEGSVSINASNGVTRKLVPGDKAVYNKNSGEINALHTNDIDNQIYWLKNILYFDNEPLADILKTFARERDVLFKLENPTTGNLRMTARFDGNETMEDILSILSQSGDFSYNRQGNIYYIK
ncbi:MAG: FecR domain-containing protein [Prevotella sp.]|jgi:ferric-dicitrate binding protein FerR (iron transport regulator)|nr:FecR domain-containing protein [Prevotella sp.]